MSLSLWMAWIPLAMGLSLFFAAHWQWRLARRHREITAKIDEASRACGDPLDWPQAAWPILERAELVGMAWNGDWFGTPLTGVLGVPQTIPLWQERVFEDEEIRLDVKAYSVARHGERRWIALQAWKLFLLHWRAKLQEHQAALAAAVRQRAEHALSLRHDLRNFAQWVEWTLGELACARDDAALLETARRLASQVEDARARARALVERASAARSANLAPPADLAAFIVHAARFHTVALTLEGAATSRTAANVWLETLDNLFANLAAEARQRGIAPQAQARLATQAEQVVMTLTLPAGMTFTLPPHRLFEPFVSGRPGGMGLGLYLARKSARAAGGELGANADPPQFILRLP